MRGAAILLLVLSSSAVAAPQLDFQGTGIGTINYGNPVDTGQTSYRPGLDISDSSIQIDASERLYRNALGSFGFGLLSPDSGNAGVGNGIFVHQAFVDLQAERYEVLIGRSERRAAHGIVFPTLRELDIVTFTTPLNPLSNGNNLEEHRYANVASFALNQELKYFEEVHAEHAIDSAAVGKNANGLNSFGANFAYLCAPGNEPLASVPEASLGYEQNRIEYPSPKSLHDVYGGAIVNINRSLTDRVDFRAQEILHFGSDLGTIRTLTDSYQAGYHATAASLRYLHSPFGSESTQLSLTGGYRGYFRVADASTFTVATTAVRSLGEGFQLLGQYRYEKRGSQLASAYFGERNENIVELGLSFDFNATMNQHLSPRRTPLNVQHQYIPD